jgi:hypothetical protein
MVRPSRVVCLALAGLVAMGCADDASTTTSHRATAAESSAVADPTTTVAALDVAETGFLVTTTTAGAAPATRPCDVLPDAAIVPGNAQVHCDGSAGWRVFAWIGESGDGIIYLEQRVEDTWVVAAHGPFCGGVGAITKSALREHRVPDDLADAWGVEASICSPNV